MTSAVVPVLSDPSQFPSLRIKCVIELVPSKSDKYLYERGI